MRSAMTGLRRRLHQLRTSAEAGMSTAEYAVGTLAAVTFATVLIAVIKSGAVKSGLASIIQAALSIAS
ncbi:DUF4244 domain-containing protein [Branchiibius sp. NY16-3462-2]|uniref:DUF4244 domain-containing protein n=1 Tax=Branchiibius sp. NY16-3462-2 TaxID=1807500 RepID=UPI000A92D214|nr:DUF4244 domain-containing protein [Branchiibius sp. NY16-3462-2]